MFQRWCITGSNFARKMRLSLSASNAAIRSFFTTWNISRGILGVLVLIQIDSKETDLCSDLEQAQQDTLIPYDTVQLPQSQQQAVFMGKETTLNCFLNSGFLSILRPGGEVQNDGVSLSVASLFSLKFGQWASVVVTSSRNNCISWQKDTWMLYATSNIAKSIS